MSQAPDIEKIVINQLINAQNLLLQSTSIGSTHVLYPQSVVVGAQQAINQVFQILSAPKPEASPKESKIEPPKEVKK